MTPFQRDQMEKEWRKAAQEFDKTGRLAGATSIFGALTAAQLSGFSIYLLATTSLATITSVIGVTLPFAAYTMMSTAIAVIIGPAGWIGAGSFRHMETHRPELQEIDSGNPVYLCFEVQALFHRE